MSAIIRKEDLTPTALDIGVWDALCEMVGNQNAEGIIILKAKEEID